MIYCPGNIEKYVKLTYNKIQLDAISFKIKFL